MTFLTEVERHLALVSQGINKQIPVFSSNNLGTLPFEQVESFDVSLPESIAYYPSNQDNRAIYLWLLLQQLAFHYFGTLRFSLDEARKSTSYLSNQDLPSHHRESDLDLLYQHFPHPETARKLFYVLEEARVRELLLSEFPGAKRLYHLYANGLQIDAPNDGTVTEDLVSKLMGELRNPKSLSPTLISLLGEIFKRDSSVYDTVNATISIYSTFVTSQLAVVDQESTPDEIPDLAEMQRAVRLEEYREELRDLDASLLAMDFEVSPGSQATSSESALEDGQTRDTDIELSQIKEQRDQLKRLVDMESSLLSRHSRSSVVTQPHFRYNEWNYLTQSWLKNWCRVFEIHDSITTEQSTSEQIEQLRHLIPMIRKQFEQVKPAGMQRMRHMDDGDEIDVDSVIQARIDALAGQTPDERIYSQRVRVRRDVSACFLVDLSASTDDPVNPEPTKVLDEDEEDPFDDPYLHGINFDPDQEDKEAPRKIIDIQKESVFLLSTALEDLGDLYSVYGFSGYSRDCVEIHIVKDFDEKLTTNSIRSINSMKPLRSTRMGPAIRHAAFRLAALGTSLKVLMVISDGFPQDCDYGPDRSNHEYGIQDTAMAIREATAKGIQVFCITVDISGHDYLKRMCPSNQYLVIEDTTELPQALQQVYKQLTAST